MKKFEYIIKLERENSVYYLIENLSKMIVHNLKNLLKVLNNLVLNSRSNNLFRIIFLTLMIIFLIFFLRINYKNLETKNWIKYTFIENRKNEVEINKVNIFDLKQPMLPKYVYDKIECRKSAPYVVITTLCVHPKEKDVHVSGSILNLGAWEDHVLRPFIKYVSNHSDWLVIDIGAQIGQYTLYAAKMGRKVIAIEPFHDNIQRIHKAATL